MQRGIAERIGLCLAIGRQQRRLREIAVDIVGKINRAVEIIHEASRLAAGVNIIGGDVAVRIDGFNRGSIAKVDAIPIFLIKHSLSNRKTSASELHMGAIDTAIRTGIVGYYAARGAYT